MPQIHYRAAEVERARIAYREAGPPEAPTFLVLHGFPTLGHMFRHLIPLLADSFQLAVPDLPGFGQLDMPPRPTFKLHIREYCACDRTLHAGHGAKLFLLPAGAEAFRRDNPQAEIHSYPTGHIALETHCPEIGMAVHDFLSRILGARPTSTWRKSGPAD